MAGFLQEFKAADILLGVIAKSRCPRLTVSESVFKVSMLCEDIILCVILKFVCDIDFYSVLFSLVFFGFFFHLSPSLGN